MSRQRKEIPLYFDVGPYLELHAERAPIARDGYYAGMTDGDVERETVNAIREFEARFGVELVTLGRSGRHICIEDTPANRARYWNLQRAAVAAVKRLFDSWRDDNRVGVGDAEYPAGRF